MVPDLVLSSTAPCSLASRARRFWPWGSCDCEWRRRQPATPSAAAPSSAWATKCGCLRDSIQSHFLPAERLPETLVTLSENFKHTYTAACCINKTHPQECLPNPIKFNLPAYGKFHIVCFFIYRRGMTEKEHSFGLSTFCNDIYIYNFHFSVHRCGYVIKLLGSLDHSTILLVTRKGQRCIKSLLSVARSL